MITHIYDIYHTMKIADASVGLRLQAGRAVIPARQRLLPMPTFGQQPVPVVTGQVVQPGSGVEVVEGRIERGPWHETDLEIPEHMRLERGNTSELVSKYRSLGRMLMVGKSCSG